MLTFMSWYSWRCDCLLKSRSKALAKSVFLVLMATERCAIMESRELCVVRSVMSR